MAAADAGAMLEALREQDLRVATIGYRLATANVGWCARTSGWTGLVLHDLAQYGPAYRGAAARLFSLGDGPGVEAVVPGSPAEAAGVRPGGRIVAIMGERVPQGGAGGGAARYDALAGTLAMLDRAAAAGPVRLDLGRRTVTLRPVRGCASQIQLETGGGVNARADGDMISVTARAAQLLPEDDDLAVLVAHELAHNILSHRAATAGKGAATVRRAEQAADRLGLWLMAGAGYDVAAGARVWARLGRRSALGLFAGPTHPGWRTRAADAAATAAAIRAVRAGGGAMRPPDLVGGG